MKISSPVFQENSSIPSRFTLDGENINPPLAFEDVPKEAKSLVLIMDDPDAPRGTWVHWTLWNIPPDTTEIWENSVPEQAIQGKTSRENYYSGPKPPSGTHRYFFKLYALDTILELDKQADINELNEAIKDHILAETSLVGLYSHKEENE